MNKIVTKRSTNGKQIHEEIFNILCHKGNTNQSEAEIPILPQSE
jgi:hypothetical protein